MILIKFICTSKIHHATITNTGINYIGSIFIDEYILEKAGLVTFEKVLIANITNGNRWETYVHPLRRKSGDIVVNGAGAKLCKKGDIIIILAFQLCDKKPPIKHILVNKNNKFMRFLKNE